MIRGLLGAEELRALQNETLRLVEAAAEGSSDPDYKYREHELTGERVPYRIEYVVDKTASCKALLGHPAVLRAVEQLQGPRFIPTWDSLVFKQAGAGAAIAWHRDAGMECVADLPIFNVDFYLDASDPTNCLWALPGSQAWSDAEAARAVEELSRGGFRTDGATALELEAGDVLLHNILMVHGSPPAQSALRRVIYLEFRPIDVELALGPHVPEYVPLKQRVLCAALAERAGAPYAAAEEPYVYRAAPTPSAPGGATEWRVPHEQYWRSAA